MNTITFGDFKKLDIRLGTIIEAEKVADADKLIRLVFDFGDEKRQIVTGIHAWYEPEDLVGKQMPVLMNLEYRKFRGVESQGMIIAADVDGRPTFLQASEKIPDGSPVI